MESPDRRTDYCAAQSRDARFDGRMFDFGADIPTIDRHFARDPGLAPLIAWRPGPRAPDVWEREAAGIPVDDLAALARLCRRASPEGPS